MSLWQFVVLAIFVLVCIFTTWNAQRKLIKVMRQRDAYGGALLKLIEASSQSHWQDNEIMSLCEEMRQMLRYLSK